MVQAGCHFYGAMAANPAPGRLEAAKAVGSAGETNGATTVAADSAVAEAGSQGDSVTTGGGTGPVIVTPWVNRIGNVGMVDGKGTLRHLELAQHDRTGLFQSFDHSGIGCRNALCMQWHPAGSNYAGSIKQVFIAERNAQQSRAAVTSQLLAGLLCLAQGCFRGQTGITVQAAFKLFGSL